MAKEIVKLTKQWIERFVIGLSLCPFAKFSFYNNTIYYDVSHHSGMSDCIDDLISLTSKMTAAKKNVISNSFLIFDQELTFDFMLDLKRKFDVILEKETEDVLFQTVVFHPEFQFADENYHASGNFTNRSPLPMMHVLRVDEVAEAMESSDDVDNIPYRNKEVLEALDMKKISEVFEDDFIEKIKKYI